MKYLKNPWLRTDPEAAVYIAGDRIEVERDGTFEAIKGQDIEIVGVSGESTRYHYSAHGLTLTLVR
jgi:hypothetical protein